MNPFFLQDCVKFGGFDFFSVLEFFGIFTLCVQLPAFLWGYWSDDYDDPPPASSLLPPLKTKKLKGNIYFILVLLLVFFVSLLLSANIKRLSGVPYAHFVLTDPVKLPLFYKLSHLFLVFQDG